MLPHRIYVYRTHIEITDYHKGDCPELELYLSIKDKPTHSLIPIGYHLDPEEDILYVPKGVSTEMLAIWFHTKPMFLSKDYETPRTKKIESLAEPRNEIQSEAIDFLLQQGEYKNTMGHTQLGLNLPTGTGKTYCAIHALVKTRRRSLVICHTRKIREQWKERILEYTDIRPERILVITGRTEIDALMHGEKDPLDYDFIITLHHALFNYAAIHGWTAIRTFFDLLKIHTKVIDESHLYFENSLMIDFFSDVYMTYYMTATFGRSDIRQRELYEKVYSTVFRFGNKVVTEQHTITTILLIDSNPDPMVRRSIEYANAYGFSQQRYQKYQMESEGNEMRRAILKAIECCSRSEGIGLITSGLIESVEWIQEMVEDEYPGKNCIAVHSKTDRSNLDDLEDVDLISATSKYIGTGNDIRGLRYIVATEAMGSRINIQQLMGRLRPYFTESGEQKDTYFFYVVDMGFPKCKDMYRRIYPVMERLSKKMYSIDLR